MDDPVAGAGPPPVPELPVRSGAMRRAEALARRVAGSRATVLLLGETGSGKEVMARRIHRWSPRRTGPFVAVNCAALPEALLESELFGHRRGAFTGAHRDHPGLFAAAHGGTLLLDEVGEMAPALQARLLRSLEEGAVRPVGGIAARPVDVRVIAATHRDLVSEVEAGRFRRDLYYRLAVFPIRIPPLRERREDLPALAAALLARHATREGRPPPALREEALDLLLAHRWPGNVRELDNEMCRALALAEPGEPVGPEHLSEALRGAGLPPPGTACAPTLREELERIEAVLIRRALRAHGGRRAATARALGLSREGLWKKLRRLGLEPDQASPRARGSLPRETAT